MKRKVMNCIFGVIFIAGLSLLLYPFVADKWNTHRQNQLMTTYEEILDEQVALGSISYEAEMNKADEYNTDLLPKVLPDAFAIYDAMDVPDEQYMSCLNVTGDGMMGSVEIPKIDVKIPIFHTTSEEVLATAAGHLAGSSLPVGGETSHAVISAHRGLPSAALFTDLDQMIEGDHFFINVLGETLCYEVDQILVVEPTETDALQIEENQDYVTLMTCTPYGVNSHRLLVRGHRVEGEIVDLEDELIPLGGIADITNGQNMSLHTNYLLWVVVGLSIVGLFVFMLMLRERSLRKKIMMRKQMAQ